MVDVLKVLEVLILARGHRTVNFDIENICVEKSNKQEEKVDNRFAMLAIKIKKRPADVCRKYRICDRRTQEV